MGGWLESDKELGKFTPESKKLIRRCYQVTDVNKRVHETSTVSEPVLQAIRFAIVLDQVRSETDIYAEELV